MPLKLNVGLSKKVGLPDYGSLGASCHVDVELEGSLLADLAGFQEKAQRAFAACHKAVNDELARHGTNGEGPYPECPASKDGNGQARNRARSCRSESNGHSPHTNGSNGNGSNGNGTQPAANPAHRASGKQLRYIEQLAGEIRDLGSRRLEGLAQQMFNKPLADLSSLDASTLIDTLKQIKAGKIDLDSIGKGAAA